MGNCPVRWGITPDTAVASRAAAAQFWGPSRAGGDLPRGNLKKPFRIGGAVNIGRGSVSILLGAAYATLLTFCLVLLINQVYLHRRLGVEASNYFVYALGYYKSGFGFVGGKLNKMRG